MMEGGGDGCRQEEEDGRQQQKKGRGVRERHSMDWIRLDECVMVPIGGELVLADIEKTKKKAVNKKQVMIMGRCNRSDYLNTHHYFIELLLLNT